MLLILGAENTNFHEESIFQRCGAYKVEFCTIVRSLNRPQAEVFYTPHVIQRSFFVLPQRRRASVEAKIRIECIVRSSTQALRDRRLNSLYRRIIANENIGCVEITNGRSADEMYDRATFRPISSTKKYSLDGLFTSFQNLLLLSTIQTINNLFVRCCFSFVLEYYLPNRTN